MRRLLVSALSALLLAMLAACESTRASNAPNIAPNIAPDAPRRCAHCGRIESKREIGPDGPDPHTPVMYEYTVRMVDGSSAVFREEPSVSWRVGERLTFIAGAGAAGR